jgi:NAD(P)-dependent dehydrogenase (short-subunit alcohol dehydrogenase family)
MRVNLNSAYYCSKAAGEIFRNQGHGSLIFTASMSGHIANVPQKQVRCSYLSPLFSPSAYILTQKPPRHATIALKLG